MNETIKVSIAGIGFTMEPGAYAALDRYLARLREEYGPGQEGDEIITDIEARIVEIVLSAQSEGNIVSEELIDTVIQQMGYPESDPMPIDVSAKPLFGFPRRLYRNPEGAKLGGVCNGIATYFNADPVWIRIGLFMPLFAGIFFNIMGLDFLGSAFNALFVSFMLLYFLLWFVLPVPRSPRQILEMNGQQINTETIGRKAPYPIAADSGARSIFAEVFSVLGRIALFSIKAMLVVIGFGLTMAGIWLVAGLLSFTVIDTFSEGFFTTAFSGLEGISASGFTGLVFGTTLILICAVVYCLLCLVFNWRIRKSLLWIAAALWISLNVYKTVLVIRNLDTITRNFWEWIDESGKEPYRYKY